MIVKNYETQLIRDCLHSYEKIARRLGVLYDKKFVLRIMNHFLAAFLAENSDDESDFLVLSDFQDLIKFYRAAKQKQNSEVINER